LQAELSRFSGQLKDGLERVSRENKDALNDLRHEIERVAQELSYHKTNDFTKLADKVAELEKIIRQLKSQVANLRQTDNTPVSNFGADEGKVN